MGKKEDVTIVREEKPAEPVEKRFYWYKLRWLVVAVFSFLLYANSLENRYAYDDVMVITGNAYVKKGTEGFKEILTSDLFEGLFGKTNGLVAGGRYRPLTLLLYATVYEFFEIDSPVVYHLINILSYTLLCVLLYVLFKKIFSSYEDKKRWWLSLPFLSALLYAAHPIHTEVVANIKGLDEIWSLMGAVGALLLAIKYCKRPEPIYLAGMSFAYLFGIFAKENAATFFGIIPITMYFFYKPKLKDYAAVMSCLTVVTVFFIAIRTSVVGFDTDVVTHEILNDPFVYSTRAQEIATVLLTWGMYAWLMIFPYNLTCDYYPNHIKIVDFSDPRVFFIIVLLMVLLFFTYKGFKKKNIFAYAVLFLMCTFSLQSNLLFNIGTYMGERFLFAPSVGILILFALLFVKVFAKMGKYPSIVFLVILFSLYSVRTVSRNMDWYDDNTLFIKDLQVSKESIKINVSAGYRYLVLYEAEKDENKKKELLNKAFSCLEKARTWHPTSYAAWLYSGNAYLLAKEWEKAIACYRKAYSNNNTKSGELTGHAAYVTQQMVDGKNYTAASDGYRLLLKMNPEEPLYKIKLADAFSYIGKRDSSIILLDEAIVSDPENPEAYNKKGEVYGRAFGDFATSEKWLWKAIEVKENYVAYENLGVCYGIQGRYGEALKMFLKSLELNEKNEKVLGDVVNTYRTMGNAAKAAEYQKKIDELKEEQLRRKEEESSLQQESEALTSVNKE